MDSKSGSSGRSIDAPDTLRSRAIARLLYLIGEGPIAGFPDADALKCIYFNGTPIQNPANGELNFKDISVAYRGGTQSQSEIVQHGAIESESQVSVELSANSPVVRSLSDSNANEAKLVFVIPSLFDRDSKGNIRETQVKIKIEVTNTEVGGAYETRIEDTIRGRTTSNYQFIYRVELRGQSPWQIRVTRLTANSTSIELQNKLFWQSYYSVIGNKLRYPNSALLSLQIPADELRSIPQTSVRLKGLFIRVPHNYNPETRSYSGMFNGSLVLAYSNNPAWVLFDMLTIDRYGCGKYIDASQVDVWSLYQIGRYCDQRVPDGNGGWEPRFTCNLYLQTAEDAYKVLSSLASVFRGMLYWAGGSIFAAQDAPATPTRLFTDANVVVEVDDSGQLTKPPFTYSGSSLRARHTVALVSWSDPDDLYKTKIEYVEDIEGIRRYGYNPTDVVAVGCTSQGQARRTGEWLLYSERLETETVSFAVGSEGLLIRPGEIVKVADSTRSGQRMGGRILAATTTTIRLDSAVTIQSGVPYTVSVLQTDGKQADYAVTGYNPATNTITTALMPSAPPTTAVWVLTAVRVLEPQLFRVISVVEKRGTYEILGLAHNPGKYNFIERDVPLQPRRISTLPDPFKPPEPPGSLQVNESLFADPNGVTSVRATLTWQPSPSALISEYRLEYRLRGQTLWAPLGTTRGTDFDWDYISPGIYEFQCFAVSNTSIFSRAIATTTEIVGLFAPPANIAGLTAQAQGEVLELRWNMHSDLDVRAGGRIEIRHTAKIGGVQWTDGSKIADVAGSANSALVALMPGTYQVAAFDTGGRRSPTPAQVTPVVANPRRANELSSASTFDPSFPGSKVDCTVIENSLRPATSYIDDAVGPPLSTDGDRELFVVEEGFYYPTGGGVLVPTASGANFRVRVSTDLQISLFNELDRFDLLGNIDEVLANIDGAPEEGASCQLQIATYPAGVTPPASSSDSSIVWRDFVGGEIECSAALFRLALRSGKTNTSIAVHQFRLFYEFIPRTETGTVTITNSASAVFLRKFGTLPDVQAVILNASAGDTLTVDRTISGITFTLSPSGTRTISWTATGFGVLP